MVPLSACFFWKNHTAREVNEGTTFSKLLLHLEVPLFSFIPCKKMLWYTSALNYKHVSGMNYAHNPRFYCIVGWHEEGSSWHRLRLKCWITFTSENSAGEGQKRHHKNISIVYQTNIHSVAESWNSCEWCYSNQIKDMLTAHLYHYFFYFTFGRCRDTWWFLSLAPMLYDMLK